MMHSSVTMEPRITEESLDMIRDFLGHVDAETIKQTGRRFLICSQTLKRLESPLMTLRACEVNSRLSTSFSNALGRPIVGGARGHYPHLE